MYPTLKIAIQKSGRLKDESIQLLKNCSINVDNGKDQLKAYASNFPIEILYLRNSDIPQYVADQVADAAIIGQNTLREKQKQLIEIQPLGFSQCRLSLAIPKTENTTDLDWLANKKIATSYPNSLRAFLSENSISADIHEISGSVEIAPNIGLADAICDLVSTGSTLFKNGLKEFKVIFESEATLACAPALSAEKQAIMDELTFRIRAVLEAKKNQYVLLNAPNDKLEEIQRILPGLRSPTVLPLAEKGWSSVHTVIPKKDFWELIKQLKDAGAEGILTTPIQKMIR